MGKSKQCLYKELPHTWGRERSCRPCIKGKADYFIGNSVLAFHSVSGRHYQPTVPISSAPPAPPPLLLLCLRHHNEGGGYSVSPATRSGPAQLGYLTDRVVGVSAIDTGEGRPNIDRESGIDRPSQILPVWCCPLLVASLELPGLALPPLLLPASLLHALDE